MKKLLEKTDTQSYTEFLTDLKDLPKVEDKLRCCLDYMRKILSSDETPTFRDFWEIKKLSLELFKEKLAPRTRNVFWAEYVELSEEGRRVKEILDEQSTFAQEQISLAIDAIERDIENFEQNIAELSSLDFPEEIEALAKNRVQYTSLQKELDLFSALAERLNELRKELIQTQMRARHKNRLFDRLSQLGDQIFPKRKKKIQKLSALFLEDVEAFLSVNAKLEKGPFFDLKSEIKALQKLAKMLRLNAQAFSQSRQQLSNCWDRIKDREHAFREKKAELKERYSQNLKKLSAQIEQLKHECEEGKLSLKEAEQRSDTISLEAKGLELGHDEVKELKKQLSAAKRPLEEKEEAKREKQKTLEALEKKKQKEAREALNGRLLEVLNQAEALALDALVEKWEVLVKEGKSLKTSGIENAMLQNRLDSIADHIQEKKWQTLLQENPEEIAASLQTLLSERHKEKRKIKEALEEHRRVVGRSSLSFEHSMLYQELIADEKMRLDALETMLEEIEEKLFDLEE